MYLQQAIHEQLSACGVAETTTTHALATYYEANLHDFRERGISPARFGSIYFAIKHRRSTDPSDPSLLAQILLIDEAMETYQLKPADAQQKILESVDPVQALRGRFKSPTPTLVMRLARKTSP